MEVVDFEMSAKQSRQRRSTKPTSRRLAWAVVLLSGGIFPLSGCGGTSTENQEEVHSAGPQPPEVNESPDEIRAQMRALQVYGRGTPEFDEWKLKLMVANDKIFQREGVEGYRTVPVENTSKASATIDPETGKIAWRAWTCYNPDCSGRGKGGGPLIFGKIWENAHIDSTDQVVYDRVEITNEDASKPPIVCPSCGKVEFLASYCSPQIELRRRQLEQELRDVRTARDQARAAKRPYPKDLRSPAEIRQEIAELPKLFLVPEDELAKSERLNQQ